MELEYVRPEDIERRSFAIIEEELGREAPEPLRSVLFRLIHTTADFSYADTLHCPPEVIPYALSLLVPGTTIVTDTNMVLSGINKAPCSAAAARRCAIWRMRRSHALPGSAARQGRVPAWTGRQRFREM